MDLRSREDMKKEAFVMKELSHPCIVRLYGVSQSRKLGSTLMVCQADLDLRLFVLRYHLAAAINRMKGLTRLSLLQTSHSNEQLSPPMLVVMGFGKLTFFDD